MAYELPSLQKKIDEFNELFELDGDWNVRYVVEEDDYDDSVLVHLYDYSETLDSDEFYGVGAYGELFPRWFERFEKAVQEDTGDAEFYFEPYSYSGHFTGRAHLKGQKRWSSTKKARLINGYPWEGPGQYTIVDAVHGETMSEWFDNEVEFEEFLGDFDDDDPHSEWEVYFDGESAYASKRAMRNKKLAVEKRAWTAEEVAREYEYYVGGQISLDDAQEIAWILDETGADISEVLSEFVGLEDAYASRKAMRNMKLSMKKKASDGWDNEICEDLVACLELCSELEYEIKHCVRGAYCREAGDTYESLGTYALALGKSLQDAGETLCDEYGDLTSEEIDEMDDSSYSIW